MTDHETIAQLIDAATGVLLMQLDDIIANNDCGRPDSFRMSVLDMFAASLVTAISHRTEEMSTDEIIAMHAEHTRDLVAAFRSVTDELVRRVKEGLM